MAKPAARILALQVVFGAAALLVIGRAGYLQLVRGREFAIRARQERTRPVEIEARRGTIYDRNGTPLAVSQAKFRVGIALDQVRDTARVIRIAARDLGVRVQGLRAAFQRGTPRYFYVHGPFTATEIDGLRRQRGVYLEDVYLRAYPSGILARPILGGLAAEGNRGASGLERYLDTLLAGTPGLTVDLKDPSGRRFESPGRRMREPVAGHDVVLALDAELQSIAEHGLAQTLRETQAEAGDVVFLDARTGELLALASRTAGGAAATASVFTGIFEPGSTAKTFTAAALLALGRVGDAETVSGEGGEWVLERGRARRVIHDTHAEEGQITLARAMQVSSNIGMAKFSMRLAPGEHYDMLRAFGFGSATGVEFPSESEGRVRPADTWSPVYDGPSVAMGYTFAVTAVQLAAAYGAIANGGVLMAPTLIREIRDPAGVVVYRHRPEPVRRVVTPELAARLRGLLAEAASDSGTGGQSQLRYGVLGKTGTSREVQGGRYTAGDYRASFAGMFPARDPQVAFVVTISRPRGDYYGGLIAAPLTRSLLQQALAARRVALDRAALAEASAEAPVARSSGRRAPAASPRNAVTRFPVPAAASRAPAGVEVPEVTGLRVRAAALALHRRGFRVKVNGSGFVTRTEPAAGDTLRAGRTVVIHARAP